MTSNSKQLPKIVAVTGPTCTGKSALSVHLAMKFNGEIINADSMQVYKYFDIGTAKPDEVLRKKINHHLIDVAEPDDDFNAAIFKKLADKSISYIYSQDHVPIIVGGTGLYIRILLYGTFKVPSNVRLRETLRKEYAEDPLLFYEKLKKIDRDYAMKISLRDRIRTVRAMEVFNLTGIKMSEWEKIHGFRDAHYNMLKIGLKRDRNELYKRIDKRVESMLESGWIEEVKGILSMGYNEKLKPFLSIGYREILLYLKGLITYEDMVKDIKKFTRHYAKRQFTWFSREKDIRWYLFPEDIKKIEKEVSDFLKDGTKKDC